MMEKYLYFCSVCSVEIEKSEEASENFVQIWVSYRIRDRYIVFH